MSVDIIEHFQRTEEGAVRRAYKPTHYYSDGNSCSGKEPYSEQEIEELERKEDEAYKKSEALRHAVSLEEQNAMADEAFARTLELGKAKAANKNANQCVVNDQVTVHTPQVESVKVSLLKSKIDLDKRVLYVSLASGLLGFILIVKKWI